MGLLDKVPFPRSQREFFEQLFSPDSGHDHDGVNSKPAAAVADGAVTTNKIAAGAVNSEKLDRQRRNNRQDCKRRSDRR